MSAGSILIAAWDGGGNVGPAIHLGQRLLDRGHRVRLMGWESMAARARSAGLGFATYPSVPPWPFGLRHEDGWDRVEAALHGEATARDICAVAEADASDVLVVDCMMRAGFEAARRLPVRTAALVHVLYRPFVHGWGDAVMHVDVAAMLAGVDRVLALTPSGLDAPGGLPANTSYVGPINAPPRPDPAGRGSGRPAPGDGAPGDGAHEPGILGVLRQPGDPWVLVSLGTTLQQQATSLPAILDALAALPVRVLLTLGGVLPVGSFAARPKVTVAGFVGHETVLPFVDLVICHGGLSTITTSLSFGVPLLCIPQGREQPINAMHVEAAGAGRTLAADAGVAAVRACVDDLLHDPATKAIARGFRDPDAGDAATRLVERLVPGRAARRSAAAERGQPTYL